MFKTAAIMLFVVLALILFHNNIKGWIVEHQMKLTISDVAVSDDTQDRLRNIASRVGRGFAAREFTDIEKETLLKLRQDLKELKQSSDDSESNKLEADAKGLMGRFEAILRRHKL